MKKEISTFSPSFASEQFRAYLGIESIDTSLELWLRKELDSHGVVAYTFPLERDKASGRASTLLAFYTKQEKGERPKAVFMRGKAFEEGEEAIWFFYKEGERITAVSYDVDEGSLSSVLVTVSSEEYQKIEEEAQRSLHLDSHTPVRIGGLRAGSGTALTIVRSVFRESDTYFLKIYGDFPVKIISAKVNEEEQDRNDHHFFPQLFTKRNPAIPTLVDVGIRQVPLFGKGDSVLPPIFTTVPPRLFEAQSS